MSPEEKQAREVVCPKCGSPAGRRCTSISHEPMSKSHSDRAWVAEDTKNERMRPVGSIEKEGT